MTENKEQPWTQVDLTRGKKKAPIDIIKQKQTQTQTETWHDTVTLFPKNQEPPKQTRIKVTGPNSQRDHNTAKYHKKVENNVDDEDNQPVKKSYSEEFRKKMTSKRTELGLTQKEFALKLNVKENLIKTIENGTAQYDPSIMTKLSHQLQKLIA
jgi:ribosome-binding protein aMBF1 (putative translation factor)